MTETEQIMDRLLRSYYCAIDAMPLPKRLGKRGGSYEHCACLNLKQCVYCAEYQAGKFKPSFQVPAIPLAVKYDYLGCVNIDDVSVPDDPIIVYMWDSWTGQNVLLNE